ncbi:AhpC/TSA family protein [Dysgonomonas sp. Marseille-P4677]|uniref:TlpA disulfide reductase family protein n=1 Tax=Dysgonomonas sp. Marseille-P4677 TaxID=2364790 RepID=UPI0019148891|nr:TlpA disulfide reductase family protein [Dysgonomonas sp. Marseille-P4677]MBK5720396.1 AhpC/TSA family protein [Dysgonomonas sp. Marseille-P4677]
MKKITLFLMILTVIVTSCQDKQAYTIEGSFAEDTFEGKTVYLQKIDSMQAESSTLIDSAVVKDSKFTFKGVAEAKPTMGFISVGRLETPAPDSPVGTLILEPGKIKISLSKNAVNTSGTPINEEFNKVQSLMNDLAALYQEVNDAGGIDGVPNANERMQTLQTNMQKAVFDFTKANMSNKAGEFLFYSAASSMTMEQLKELLPLADSTFLNTAEIKALSKELNRIVPEVGQPFADVQLIDMTGKSVSLSEHVGKSKCVLIDFWASWCGPCIQEMPNLVKTYAAYKAKGLEIVGVSVDDDKQAWTNAVKIHNMSWIQLGDDTKSASELYGVNTIPHTILLDANGVILAKDLRGKELEAKIAEVLN